MTGGVGAHASFDSLGGDFIGRYAEAMTKGGLLLSYGALSGQRVAPPFLPMIQKSLWFHAYSVFNYVQDADAIKRGTAFVHEAIADGRLTPRIDRVLPMESYADAWRYLKSARATYGKVVVETGL